MRVHCLNADNSVLRITKSLTLWEGCIIGGQIVFQNVPHYISYHLSETDFPFSPLFFCYKSRKPNLVLQKQNLPHENLRFNERKYRRRPNFFSKCSSLHFLSSLGSRFFIFAFVLLLKISKSTPVTPENGMKLKDRRFTYQNFIALKSFPHQNNRGDRWLQFLPGLIAVRQILIELPAKSRENTKVRIRAGREIGGFQVVAQPNCHIIWCESDL